ncbi:MAG: tRNA (adenosine(37)-N6)-threonylcarbamoyltransferase complex dimerization subunit type 1 TsaB [Bryobacteraceae bacterium]
MILAIDTTSEFGSLALVDAGGVVGEMPMHSPDGFSHLLYGYLTSFLDDHRLTLADITGFVSAAGPGSFTGVRVGLAAVKGLAEATGKPAIAVSNLQALSAFGELPLRAVLLDARRGDIFGAVYSSSLEVVQPEVVIKFETWLESLPGEVEFISTEMDRFEASFAETRFAAASRSNAPRILAGAIAKIAWQRLQQGETGDPALLDANYVRRSDAELFWTEPLAKPAPRS